MLAGQLIAINYVANILLDRWILVNLL